MLPMHSISKSSHPPLLLSPGTYRATNSHSDTRRPYGLNVPYRKLFSHFEQIMLRHCGKPHWAKTHPLRPDDLRKMYPRFDDFVRLVERVDPHGVFRNPYVERHLFGMRGHQYDERVFKKR